MSDNTPSRLIELEMKIAFQEKMIEELNEAITSQQFQLDKIQRQLYHVANKLKDMQPTNIASLAEETPPPHY